MEGAVSERRKAFTAAHRSDKDRQAYVTASRRASSVIDKAKAEAWQTTWSSLSPKSNPKTVYSLLRSIDGSPFWLSSSSNFPNCSSPRESASVYAAYLRSHFSVSQPKTLRRRARGYLSEFRRATCPAESHSSFCSPFSPTEFLSAASNLSSSTVTGPDKVAYPMLKHLPRSGMDFLLHIFNLSWTSHSFPSIWKKSSIIPIHKMGKPLDSPASFRPISLTSCVSKLFDASFYPVYFSFWNLIPFSLPARPVSALDGLHLIKFCSFLSPFRMGLTNPDRALGRSCLLSISLKLLTLSGIPPFTINSFRLASLLALLVGLNLSFLIGVLAWFIKFTKVVPFESVEMFPKDPFLALYFSVFSSMIFRLLYLFPSAALFTLTIWSFWSSSPLVPTAVEATQGALFRLERWSEHWCLPLNPSKCEASFFSMDPHQAHLQPNLLLLGSRLRFNPTPTFLGVTFDLTLFFSKHVSSLKAKFFPPLKALRCISASSWGPSRESLSVLYKAFLWPLLCYASPRWFLFFKRCQYHKIGTPPPSGQSRHHRLPPVLPYPSSFSPRFLYLPYELP